MDAGFYPDFSSQYSHVANILTLFSVQIIRQIWQLALDLLHTSINGCIILPDFSFQSSHVVQMFQVAGVGSGSDDHTNPTFGIVPSTGHETA
jgi:hypothetical protein